MTKTQAAPKMTRTVHGVGCLSDSLVNQLRELGYTVVPMGGPVTEPDRFDTGRIYYKANINLNLLHGMIKRGELKR